jgi:aryl-alcohol dehydrogenase-like predicted oxidoreductase
LRSVGRGLTHCGLDKTVGVLQSSHEARFGQQFNVGETFAGIPFEKGAELAEEMKAFVPEGLSMVQLAQRWILDYPAVSVIIPGASSVEQAKENARASDLPPLARQLHDRLENYYQNEVGPFIRGPY